jgi:hypothetical protein
MCQFTVEEITLFFFIRHSTTSPHSFNLLAALKKGLKGEAQVGA